MKGKKTVAVVPAYNEEKRLGPVLKELKKYVGEIVVSDDGSTDRTAEIARKAGAKVISSPVNMGVGHATRLGCEYAIERMNADILVLIDADGQHSPKEIPKLLEKIDSGCEFVFTNRFGDSQQMPLIKKVGNRALSLFTNMVAGTSVSDTQSGFKAFKASCYPKLKLSSNKYEICSEFVIKVGRNRVSYCQVPVQSRYDEWTRVKGTGIRTGLSIFMNVIRILFG